ncbi:hypothetical protein J6590_044029 [Homalodisca vitripennis]|nr:hypothetical protein J6590_044029 [Homalodisca vitripennis]
MRNNGVEKGIDLLRKSMSGPSQHFQHGSADNGSGLMTHLPVINYVYAPLAVPVVAGYRASARN